MAEVGLKKDEVLNVTSSSLSPADLEAEIAASADAIGGAETVKGVAKLADTKPKPKKKRATKKAAPKKTTKKLATKKTTAKKTVSKKKPSTKKAASAPAKKTLTVKKSQAKEPEVTDEKVVVTVKPTEPKTAAKTPQKKGKVMATSDVRPGKRVTKKATIETSGDDAPSAVKVRVKPKSLAVESGKVDSSTTPAQLNHHAKTLKPIRSAEAEVSAKTVEKETPQSTPPVTLKREARIQEREHREPKPYEPIHVKETLKPKSTPEKEVEKVPQKQHKHTPHVARIYDTETYHIPLTVDKHHRRAIFPRWAQVLILLIAIAGMIFIGSYLELLDFS